MTQDHTNFKRKWYKCLDDNLWIYQTHPW